MSKNTQDDVVIQPQRRPISLKLNNTYDAQSLPLYAKLFKKLFHSPDIDTIYFEGNKFSEWSCNDISHFMRLFVGSNVKKLYLGNNGLGRLTPDKIEVLINGLAQTKITELSLNDNRLSELGTGQFKLLLDCLRKTSIKKLNLSNNYLHTLGEKGLSILQDGVKDTTLQAIDVSNNGFNDYLPGARLARMLEDIARRQNKKREEIEEKLRQEHQLNHIIEFARFSAAIAEKRLPRGSVKPYNKNPSFLTKIGLIFKKIINGIKNIISNWHVKYKEKSFLDNKGGYKNKALIVEKNMHQLQKNILQNRLRCNTDYSLKKRAIFSILCNEAIAWRKAPLPLDLKETLSNTFWGLRVDNDKTGLTRIHWENDDNTSAYAK